MIYDPTVVPDYQGQPNQLGGMMRLAGLGTTNFQRSPAAANAINAIANIGRQPQGQQPATNNLANQLMPMLLRRALAQRGQATPTPVGSDPAPGTTTRMSDSPPSDTPAGVEARIKLDQTAVSGGWETPTAAAMQTPTTTPEVQQRAAQAASTPPVGTPAVPNPATPVPAQTLPQVQSASLTEDAPHGFQVNMAGSPHSGDPNGQLQIHVTPTEDQMMHWNKTVEQQPQQVQDSLNNMYPGRDMMGKTGAQIYNQDVGNEMVNNGTMYSQARAGVSDYYHQNGISGAVLQDGDQKSAVVFHPSNISYSANGYQLEPVDYTPNFKQGGAISGAIPGVVQSTVYPNQPAADIPPPPPPFITPTAITGE